MSSIPQQSAPVFDGAQLRVGFGRLVKMLGAGAWAMALAVIGFWILLGSSLPGFLGALTPSERGLVGLGMLSGGQLVFLLFVAERVFSKTSKRLTIAAHWGLMGVGGACLVLFVFGRVFSGV